MEDIKQHDHDPKTEATGQMKEFLSEIQTVLDKYPAIVAEGFTYSSGTLLVNSPDQLVQGGITPFCCKVWCAVNGTWFCCLSC